MATTAQYTAQPIVETFALSSTHVNAARDGSGTRSTFATLSSADHQQPQQTE
jgi:hypothetical protein